MLSLHPPYRASLSLTDMDDAETVEYLSEDSCSTTSTSSQDMAPTTTTTTVDALLPLTASDKEAQLRRKTLHESSCIPLLRPQPAWLEECVATGQGPSPSATEMLWTAAHADHLTVAVRWRVMLASPDTECASFKTTLWVPYAVPLAQIITSRTTASADTANTLTSTTSSSGWTTQPLRSVQLPLGRAVFLLAAQLSSLVPGAWGSEVSRESLTTVANTISRAQCALHLHYLAVNAPRTLSPHLARPVCRSFDVFAISPTTTLLGVALQPHQRYHIKRRKTNNKAAYITEDQPCDSNGVLTLRLGPYCHADVALDGVPPDPRLSDEGNTRPSIDPNTNNCGHERTMWNVRTPYAAAVLRSSARQSGVEGKRPSTAMSLHCDSAASLITGESTAVLATLSNTSEPVTLSDTSDYEHNEAMVSPSQTLAATPSHTLTRVPPGAAPRKSRKRQRPTTTRGHATKAVIGRGVDTDVEPVVMVGNDGDADAAAVPPGSVVLFTTGMRLSSAEEEALKELGALVNPHLRFARYASVLVAKRPLLRSVKLLTALPYIQNVVHQGWLDAVLHAGTLNIPVEGFAYRERKMVGSIESDNNFDLRETMNRSPTERQRLFAQQRFWVHKSASPQDPPMNDLKTVLVASGGLITRRALDANVFVLPNNKPSLPCWRGVAQQLGGPGKVPTSSTSVMSTLAQCKQAGVLFVVPDDIFKCVLQQRRLSASSITLPRQFLTEGAATRGSTRAASNGRRSSPAARKTPRTSTTKKTPRPSLYELKL
ncbi:hypothetical protein JKF63_07183 [Porcisia hertigi]|uniref:BRCT domain-containing protein n=1 Tax=Porcisia hertigi TaxID=2761500 RepID=A0A836LKH4_9TRYP|nr:hypothetical protein JKF63_07183 [Porcisia hertigi]